ncbi:MAG: hypothetical protein FWE37_05925 [Spirochaetaceae bacterium]|nr:hypothetical protein [Spirochaetaceae bacterium]
MRKTNKKNINLARVLLCTFLVTIIVSCNLNDKKELDMELVSVSNNTILIRNFNGNLIDGFMPIPVLIYHEDGITIERRRGSAGLEYGRIFVPKSEMLVNGFNFSEPIIVNISRQSNTGSNAIPATLVNNTNIPLVVIGRDGITSRTIPALTTIGTGIPQFSIAGSGVNIVITLMTQIF